MRLHIGQISFPKPTYRLFAIANKRYVGLIRYSTHGNISKELFTLAYFVVQARGIIVLLL